MKLGILLLSLVIAECNAFLFDSGGKWDGLNLFFDPNPFNGFKSKPRILNKKSDWKQDLSAGGCGVPGTKFAGNRYIKDNDIGVMLLYDVNGFIAGIQAGVPVPKTPNSYPAPQNSKYHVFLEEKNMWVVTAYFVDPATICTTGRTQEEFDKQGTGYRLSIQVGDSPASLLDIPLNEKEVEAKTKFVQGKCFYTMGMHYWYDISKDMSCDDTFPVFLLYNGGKLNGFGWAFNPDIKGTSWFEHPTKNQFGMFMKEPPTCLGKDAPVSTLHIYLTDSPRTGNFC